VGIYCVFFVVVVAVVSGEVTLVVLSMNGCSQPHEREISRRVCMSCVVRRLVSAVAPDNRLAERIQIKKNKTGEKNSSIDTNCTPSSKHSISSSSFLQSLLLRTLIFLIRLNNNNKLNRDKFLSSSLALSSRLSLHLGRARAWQRIARASPKSLGRRRSARAHVKR
jgi:hypothetical protein